MIAVGMHFSWKLHSLLQPQTMIRNRSNQPFLPLKPTENFSIDVLVKFLIRIIGRLLSLICQFVCQRTAS